MGEKQVGVAALIACLLWTLGVAIVVVDVVAPVDLGSLGIVFVAGGAVMTNRRFIHGMRERQRDVFQMGRDYERGQLAGVRSLR